MSLTPKVLNKLIRMNYVFFFFKVIHRKKAVKINSNYNTFLDYHFRCSIIYTVIFNRICITQKWRRYISFQIPFTQIKIFFGQFINSRIFNFMANY